MDFSTTRKRFGDVKILNILMAVILPGTSVSNLLPFGYQSLSTNMDALDVSRQVNIFIPGLFVPALFVMHDVSLTPTKKVA
ncbi:hypothetical protein K492DRAFT_173034 [Lichtheimia hyalospora FSU 10163]|nr:hypothetical protein K492DRAFT_173034 [Lichtheimia hyalospora FSU 10163]